MVQISVRLTDPIPNDSNIGRTNRSNYSDTIPTNPNISQTNQSNKLSIDVAVPILKKRFQFFPFQFSGSLDPKVDPCAILRHSRFGTHVNVQMPMQLRAVDDHISSASKGYVVEDFFDYTEL